MNSTTLLVLGVLGFGAFYMYKQGYFDRRPIAAPVIPVVPPVGDQPILIADPTPETPEDRTDAAPPSFSVGSVTFTSETGFANDVLLQAEESNNPILQVPIGGGSTEGVITLPILDFIDDGPYLI